MSTVEAYLNDLPEDRRAAVSEVRQAILKNLPDGYEEVINWGMITYQVPLEAYPDTYNKKPLMYAALASQKRHMAVYLSCIYPYVGKEAEFRAEWAKSGKRLDMGKSCVRFRKLEDLELDLIGKTIGEVAMADYVAHAKKLLAERKASKKK